METDYKLRALKEQQIHERRMAEIQKAKEELEKLAFSGVKDIKEKFSSTGALELAIEGEFKEKTVGLVSVEKYREAREEAERKASGLQSVSSVDHTDGKRKVATVTKKRPNLSFADDDEEEDLISSKSKVPKSTSSVLSFKKIGKDPNAKGTEHLPDRERDLEEQRLHEKLKAEFLEQQEREKNEMIEVVYSYWDGTGHRRSITLAKDTKITKFLEFARNDLSSSFPELKTVSSFDLMFVKEDYILPPNISFYDLIVRKAMGKSGPLFDFSITSDKVVMVGDSRVAKDQSHPGKIVERRWYDQNKHIFPASRWEFFDAAKFLGSNK